MSEPYKTFIGLEVHIELSTDSKMFCGCPAFHFGKEPNTQVCPVCLGLPGALPVPNKKAIEATILLGLVLGCGINKDTHFDRKHYFYPDLPKGYQISQYDRPIAIDGQWQPRDGQGVRIRRVHLEEDTGKLLHRQVEGKKSTLVDFNRSGVPLVEIVTEPDFSDTQEVILFLRDLQRIVRYLGISDADMEKGSMRLEGNVSVGKSKKLPNYRVELKNINSFRFLERAIGYEVKRQREAQEKGETLTQETRGYDEAKGVTRPQRWKEEAKDYRYFPEPDIPPINLTDEDIEEIRSQLPELPSQKRERFKREYGLSDQYAIFLTESKQMADYFEEAIRIGQEHNVSAKKIADTLVNKKPDIEEILPAKLIEILRAEEEKPGLPEEELEKAIVQSIEENPQAVEDYKKGKEQAIQFLVGQVMGKTKGQADPQGVRKLIEEKLK